MTAAGVAWYGPDMMSDGARAAHVIKYHAACGLRKYYSKYLLNLLSRFWIVHGSSYTQGALNHGLSREEIEEVFVQLTIYAGIPKAVGGVQAAKRVFAKIDARAARL